MCPESLVNDNNHTNLEYVPIDSKDGSARGFAKVSPSYLARWPYDQADHDRFHEEPEKESGRSDFERDRARILHSAGLRRLGTKTQVLGPTSDDFVRTRLTHSLEVAQVGRGLAQELGCDPDVVDAACLAHDLGHPPFGHNGERALDDAAKDIGGFEGNAQTFRLVVRLETKFLTKDFTPGGLNLTRATLDALTKYPWAKDASNPLSEPNRKFGHYDDDSEIFSWMRESAPRYRRCLESQVMDLSDDIAYSVHDLEDAVVTGHLDLKRLALDHEVEQIIDSTVAWYGNKITPAELEYAADRLLALPYWPASYDGSYRGRAQMKDLTSQLIGRFCTDTEHATREKYGDGPLGRYGANLVVPQQVQAEITLLKGIAVHYVMSPRELEPRYFQERTIITDLVDALVEAGPSQLEGPFAEEWERADDDGGRLRAVIDQVASLTDVSASEWHSRLCGMLSTLL